MEQNLRNEAILFGGKLTKPEQKSGKILLALRFYGYLKVLFSLTITAGLALIQVATIPTYAQLSLPDSKSYSTQADYNGTYANTAWNTTKTGVTLSGTNTTGTYTSPIYNAGEVVNWTSVQFNPDQYYGTQLPDNGGSNGSIDMTGNFGLYHFNEVSGSTSWNDTSGAGNTGTCGPSCPNVSSTGLFGNAISFNQTGSSYLLPSTLTVRGLSTISMGVWINPSQVSGDRTIYEEVTASSNNTVRFSFMIQNGFIRMYGRYNDAAINPQFDFTSTQPIIANQWQHIGVIYNANTGVHSIVVNGVGQTFNLSVGAMDNTASRNPSQIGQSSGNGNAKYVGLMDEFATFNRPLSSSEMVALSSSGSGNVTMQLRSCGNATCSTSSFIGPGGTSASSDVYSINGVPSSYNLTSALYPASQYFQYRYTFTRSVVSDLLNPAITSTTINFTRPSAPILSFAIRNELGSSNINSCDFGEASTTATAFCRYRLWINTNATSGYSVFVRVDGNLRTSSNAIANAATASAGGSDISNTTAGTEQYGIMVYPGGATGGTPVVSTNFAAGTNASALTNTSNLLLVSSNGPNVPTNTSTTQTILMEHRLNISGTTPPGTYAQRVTFSVVPNF